MLRWWLRLREQWDSWRFGAIDSSVPVGQRGEQYAARYLRKAGYTIVAQGNVISLASWT